MEKMPRQEGTGRKRGRFRIRYLITILIVMVFIIFAAITLFLFNASQDRLMSKSKDQLIQTMCEDASSAANSLMPFIGQIVLQKMGNPSPQDLIAITSGGGITELQKEMDAVYQGFIDDGLLGIQKLIGLLPPTPPLTKDWLVVASNDDSLVGNWSVPQSLIDAINAGDGYLYSEAGFPDLGIDKDGLMFIETVTEEGPRVYSVEGKTFAVGVKSIEDAVARIDSFVAHEKKNTAIIFSLVIIGCLLLIMTITFFILSYLIRTRITQPIDALAATAEKVMEGDLSSDIEVHSGGDFESLERAFKEMIEAIRLMLDRSVGKKK